MATNQPATLGAIRPKRGTRTITIAIAIVAVLVLVVVASSSGHLANRTSSSVAVVNSPGTPFSGEQLFAAYTSNESLADATYTQKLVYIQDVIDPGQPASVNDPETGEYYSTVNFGTVVLYWSQQSQALQISPLQKILAQCNVEGMKMSVSGFYLLYLTGCQLVTPG